MKILVAYPDFALEKFKRLSPNEDAGDFLKLLEKKISPWFWPADPDADQPENENRQKALYGLL